MLSITDRFASPSKAPNRTKKLRPTQTQPRQPSDQCKLISLEHAHLPRKQLTYMLLFYHWNTLLSLGQLEHQHGLQHW